MNSNNLDKVLMEAVNLANKYNHQDVNQNHVLAAALKCSYFKDALVKYAGEDAVKGIMDTMRRSPQLNRASIERIKESGVLRRILRNQDLACKLDMAERIAAGTPTTGQIELSHVITAMMVVGSKANSSCILCDMLKTATARNEFLNELFAAESKQNGGRGCEHYDFPAWADLNPAQQARHGNGEQSEFYTDMIEMARNDHKPFVGRDEELNALLDCLERMDKPNAIITGEPGVGKSDIMRGLAKKFLEDGVDTRILRLDVPAMLAGSQFRGQFEDRLKKVLNEITAMERPIVFIDEIHTIMRAGAGPDSSMDAANILKPYLTEGKMRVVGATTREEYRKFIENDAAFMRRFMEIGVAEPDIATAIGILKGTKNTYEKFHGVKIPVAAIEAAVNLSAKHMHDRFLPDKAIDIMDQTCARLKRQGEKKITVADVETTIATLCHIPKTTVDQDEMSKVRNLAPKMKEQVFGQDTAINQLTEAIQMSKVGLNDETKPIGAFLFVGPSGVGKTEIAKQLAVQLGVKFIRFDMSEYGEPHSVAKLIGAPAGYVGYDDGGILVEEIRQNPHSVVLFDEIEKAHPDVYKIFLQMMDYGMLTDNKGRKADFRNTVIIMTSNAGNSVIEKHVGFNKSTDTLSSKALNAVNTLMPPELRGRMSAIITFNPISNDMAKSIVRKEMKSLLAKLKAKGVTVNYTDDVVDEIVVRGVSAQYGAREIQKVINTEIKKLFVKELMAPKPSDSYTLSVNDGKFAVQKTRAVVLPELETVK